MSVGERIECLWNGVNRVDSYITSSNFKTALTLTFNVGLFGAAYQSGIILNPESLFHYICISFYLVFVFFGLFFSLLAVSPNIKGGGGGPFYFFGLVNEAEAKKQKLVLLESTDEQIFESLYQQYVDISKVAEKKFSHHSKAVRLVQVSMLFLFVLVALKIF